MKRRAILWTAGVLLLLMLARCHFVVWPMRRADAVLTVKTAGYCACPECSGWKFNWLGFPVSPDGKTKMIGRTSSGKIARPGIVAVDPNVFPPGTRFYIPGYGWGRAEDTSGKGRNLDLYFWMHHSAEKWGAQTKKVKVWYPRK